MSRGTGGRSLGEKGREVGGEREGSGILKLAWTGRKRVKFCNISLYFGIDMRQRGENGYGKGWEAGVKGTESGRFRPPVPLHKNIKEYLVTMRNQIKSVRMPSTGTLFLGTL